MEGELWTILYAWVVAEAKLRPRRKRVRYGDWVILLVVLWAALHDRPLSWACRARGGRGVAGAAAGRHRLRAGRRPVRFEPAVRGAGGAGAAAAGAPQVPGRRAGARAADAAAAPLGRAAGDAGRRRAVGGGPLPLRAAAVRAARRHRATLR